ncbi:MAG: M48 family metallopeptidase [Elusimicrobia bacterium]|nr:M48 family metallopeptidase [Elusimicrobiota bacterium]
MKIASRWIWAVVTLAAACQSVPYTNRSRLLLVSASEEAALGQTSYKKALAEAKLSMDDGAIATLRRVGERLAKAADKPDYQWEFNLIDDPKTINAWCLPGGKVAVYTGILPVTQDENGLAVVLGHEIAHALARHGSERMSQGLIANLGGAALGAAMASKPAATQQLAQQAYGLGANVGVLLPFSRAQESEADRIGLILMAKAGYDPSSAVGFWERMSQASGGSGGNGLERYLRTHPADSDRIDMIKEHLPEARGYFIRTDRP